MKQTVAKFLGTVVAVTGVLFATIALAGAPKADALPVVDRAELVCFVGCCSTCNGWGGMCCRTPPFPVEPYPGIPDE